MTKPSCKRYHYRGDDLVEDIFRPGDRVDIHIDGFGTIQNVGSTLVASDIDRAVQNAYARGRADKLADIRATLGLTSR